MFLLGVDTSEPVTESAIHNVTLFLGAKPRFWGRYLFTVTDYAQEVTKEEIDLLRRHQIELVLVCNAWNTAKMIEQKMRNLDAAEGSVLFLDIEWSARPYGSYPVQWALDMTDLGYIPGWYLSLPSPNAQALWRSMPTSLRSKLLLWDAHWLAPSGTKPDLLSPLPPVDCGIAYHVRQIGGNIDANGTLVDIDILVPGTQPIYYKMVGQPATTTSTITSPTTQSTPIQAQANVLAEEIARLNAKVASLETRVDDLYARMTSLAKLVVRS